MGDRVPFPLQTNEGGEEDYAAARQDSRRALLHRVSAIQKKIRASDERRKHWEDEARANEQKKDMCTALIGVAVANDVLTIFADVVSIGLLGSLTAPVTGILRFMVSAYEREQKSDRLLRTVIVVGLKAIPFINVLPATTFLMITDLAEATADMEFAKNNQRGEEKKIKKLTGELNRLKIMAQRQTV